jgi:hypothetical protein
MVRPQTTRIARTSWAPEASASSHATKSSASRSSRSPPGAPGPVGTSTAATSGRAIWDWSRVNTAWWRTASSHVRRPTWTHQATRSSMAPSGWAAARANASAAYSSPESRLRVVTASDRTT